MGVTIAACPFTLPASGNRADAGKVSALHVRGADTS